MVIHDLTKPLPFRSHSVDGIYASHVFEHLSRSSVRQLLAESLRTLKPGGILRVIVPDLDALIAEYTKGGDSNEDRIEANQRFVRGLHMTYEDQRRPSFLLRLFRGTHDKNLHRFVYNEATLRHDLIEAGFEAVERRQCYQSDLPDIQAIEQPDRIDGAICLEGYKQRP